MRTSDPVPKRAAKPRVLRSSALTGLPVVNPAGDPLGSLEEVIVDLEFGVLAYAVLSFGEDRGGGGRLHAVPWQAIEVDTAHDRALLAIPEEKLRKAPRFDDASWPDFGNRRWGKQIHAYYDQKVYWT